jgi:hypothetical protein
VGTVSVILSALRSGTRSQLKKKNVRDLDLLLLDDLPLDDRRFAVIAEPGARLLIRRRT